MKNTLILILAAIPTGIAVGAVDAVFGRVLLYIGEVRDAHVFWLVPFLGVVGAAMAWAYKNYGAGCESGMGMVFEAGHGEREEIPLRLIPFVMCATWLTHLFGGSAGREGVAVQLGAAISHSVGRLLRFEDAPRIMLITGMSAGFAGLFRTPFAATAFAMEVLTAGRLEHRALLPAATAASLVMMPAIRPPAMGEAALRAYSLPKSQVEMVKLTRAKPTRPIRAMTTVFHSLSRDSRSRMVPRLTSSTAMPKALIMPGRVLSATEVAGIMPVQNPTR